MLLFKCIASPILPALRSHTLKHETNLRTAHKRWWGWRQMWRRKEVWLPLESRSMIGVNLTCRQDPRCLLVFHCHLCQQTMSCIQPLALKIYSTSSITQAWKQLGEAVYASHCQKCSLSTTSGMWTPSSGLEKTVRTAHIYSGSIFI